jgi:hypothetical protein
MRQKPTKRTGLELRVIRLTRTLYFFIGLLALLVIIFDAGNVLTREAVIQRWSTITILLVLNTLVWQLARRIKTELELQILVWPLIIALIVSSAFIVYWERGMASMSTLLFAVPIASVSILKSRIALLTTAAFCTAGYSFAVVKYFNDFFNEGFRVQMWGQVVFFSGLFFVLAWIIMVSNGIRKDQQ